MKRNLLSIALLAGLSFSASAQLDTLNEFFTGNPVVYTTTQGGVVAGTNEYGDLAKMQLFDAAHGVANSGTINSVLMGIPAVIDGGASIDVIIWANEAGAPGAVLATKTIALASIDTNAVAFMSAGGTSTYNVVVTFDTPLAIPASKEFWAGITIPQTGADLVGLYTNEDGDFADGGTHTGEFWSDSTFHTFGDAQNWGINIALAIFPVLEYAAPNAVAELTSTVTSIFPNPATDFVTFSNNEVITSIEIYAVDGKLVSVEKTNATVATINVADFANGVYTCKVTSANGSFGMSKFVKQ